MLRRILLLSGLLAGLGFTAYAGCMTSRQAPEEDEEVLLKTASEQTRSIVALRRWLLGKLAFDNSTFREGDAASFFVQCTLSRKGRFEGVEVLRCPLQSLSEQVVAWMPKAPTPSPRPCGPDGRPADIAVAFDVAFMLKTAADGTLRAVDRYTYAEADVPPTFLKGDANQFYVWLSRQIAGSIRVDSLRGCIDMVFTVEDDGSVSNPRVVGDSEVELAAKIGDIVLTSPRWEPARILDQAVRVQMPLYVDFGPMPETENPDSCSVEDGGRLEVFPLFKGGDLNAFRQWIVEQIRYPQEALENNIRGRVVLSFVIEEDGSLTNIVVLSSPHELLTKEAVRVVLRSPKWRPGVLDGRIVRVKYTIPLDFRMLGDPAPPPFSAPILWVP